MQNRSEGTEHVLRPAPAETAGQIAMRLVRDKVEVSARLSRASMKQLARGGGVSPASILRALTVKRWAPDLVESVVRGQLQLHPAYAEAARRRPATVDHVTPGKRLRDERLRQMAEEGYSEDDIATAIGVSPQHVRQVMHRLGLDTLSQKLRVVRRLDHDAIMERIVTAAEPSVDAIGALDIQALDPERLADWQGRLTEAIREWTHLRNRLRRVPRDQATA